MTPEELSELYSKDAEAAPSKIPPGGPKPPVGSNPQKTKPASSEPEQTPKKGPSVGTICLLLLVVSALGIAGYQKFIKKPAATVETPPVATPSRQIASDNSSAPGNIDSQNAAATNQTSDAASVRPAQLTGTTNTDSATITSNVFNTNIPKAESVDAMLETLKKKEMENGPDFAKEFPLGYALFGLGAGQFFVPGPPTSQPLNVTWSEEKILIEEDYLHVWLPEIQIGNEEKFSLLRDLILPARADATSGVKFDLASKAIVEAKPTAEKTENEKPASHEMTVRILSVDEKGIVAVFGVKAL